MMNRNGGCGMRVNGHEVMTTGREGVGRFRWLRVHTAEI